MAADRRTVGPSVDLCDEEILTLLSKKASVAGLRKLGAEHPFLNKAAFIAQEKPGSRLGLLGFARQAGPIRRSAVIVTAVVAGVGNVKIVRQNDRGPCRLPAQKGNNQKAAEYQMLGHGYLPSAAKRTLFLSLPRLPLPA